MSAAGLDMSSTSTTVVFVVILAVLAGVAVPVAAQDQCLDGSTPANQTLLACNAYSDLNQDWGARGACCIPANETEAIMRVDSLDVGHGCCRSNIEKIYCAAHCHPNSDAFATTPDAGSSVEVRLHTALANELYTSCFDTCLDDSTTTIGSQYINLNDFLTYISYDEPSPTAYISYSVSFTTSATESTSLSESLTGVSITEACADACGDDGNPDPKKTPEKSADPLDVVIITLAAIAVAGFIGVTVFYGIAAFKVKPTASDVGKDAGKA